MYILSKEEIFSAERFTIEKIKVKEEILMEIAGQKMADEICKMFDVNKKIIVFCGVGNNGGDGFVVARKLKSFGFFVKVFIVGDLNKFKKSAYLNYLICKNLNIDILNNKNYVKYYLDSVDIVVDAIFGVGFKGELKFPFNEIIRKINISKAKVISLDVPSGVYANENIPAKGAVKADVTLTVSFLKQSYVLYPSKLYYGKTIVLDAGIFLDKYNLNNFKRSWSHKDFLKTFVKKTPNTHKSKEGKILIVGGCNNMPGAVTLSAKACYKSGAGLVVVATTEYAKKSLVVSLFEASYLTVTEENGFLKDFEFNSKFNVIACGPGLGREKFTREVVKKVALYNAVVVFDADALYFFDEEIVEIVKKRNFPTILTPHNKEMARLCRVSTKYVENNRFNISKEKAKELNSYVVLKGPHTVVSTPFGEQFVNFSGNSGLAKGGSGDVLTGIIASFVARCENVQHAVSNAVFVHGKVCDVLINKNESKNTVTPNELIENLNISI